MVHRNPECNCMYNWVANKAATNLDEAAGGEVVTQLEEYTTVASKAVIHEKLNQRDT